MRFQEVRCAEDIIRLVEEIGFLPFFANGIAGFSVEECCPAELWFSAEVDGPWEWKGPIARSGRCIYGKFFSGKAGFVSREWLPDFTNYRRDGYDFDARYDDGLASYKDKGIYEAIAGHGALLSKELKKLCNYGKGGNKGFDTVITRLQMQAYVDIADFVYMRDKFGRPYGWGVARYSTPEAQFGYEYVTSAYRREPEESKQRMFAHLQGILPDVRIAENGIPFSMKIEDNSESLEKKRGERAAETMAAMRKFQDTVGENRGWDSEENVLKDLADFRREKMCR